MAQARDDFASLPAFNQSTATGVVHVGTVYVNGSGCASGTRTLAEYRAAHVFLDG